MTQYPPPGGPDSTPSPLPAPIAAPGPAPGPVPGAAYPAYPMPGQAPWGPPVHQPGVVPLRPLTLGDIYGGALQTIRRNPKATVGMAAVVTLAFMLLPILGTIVLGFVGSMSAADPLAPEGSAAMDATDVGLLVSTLVSSVFSLLSSIVVTGLIVLVVEHALVGRRLTMGAAWLSGRGRLLPLLGLALVVGVGFVLVVGIPIGLGVLVGRALGITGLAVGLGILGGLLGLVAATWLYVRFALLAAPSVVVERRGVRGSITRAGHLSRGQFWRLFGIYLLANVIVGFIGQVIAIPFAILGVVSAFLVPPEWALASVLLSSHLSTVLVGALVGPFTAAVMALQYYDQRFRKEGLDIELLNRSLAHGDR